MPKLVGPDQAEVTTKIEIDIAACIERAEAQAVKHIAGEIVKGTWIVEREVADRVYQAVRASVEARAKELVTPALIAQCAERYLQRMTEAWLTKRLDDLVASAVAQELERREDE